MAAGCKISWSASVPFATSCDDALEYGGCIRDQPGDTNGTFTPGIHGGIETDKVGELGLGYVLFYEMTGERKYLDTGLRCPEALAKHIRPGDGSHTPWPYRLNARSGEVINGEEFSGMMIAPVRLFDELLRLGAGDAQGLGTLPWPCEAAIMWFASTTASQTKSSWQESRRNLSVGSRG